MNLRDWIPEWLNCYKNGTMKQSSYQQLLYLLKKIPDSLLDTDMDSVRPMDVQLFVNEFAKIASKSYMDKMRVALHSLWITGVENGICTRNPTRTVRFPVIAERKRQAFTAEQVRTILHFALDYPNRQIGVAITVLLLTGIRRGELLGLKWTDISDHTISIRRSVYLEDGKPCVRENIVKTSRSLRIVPIPPELTYMIFQMPRKCEFVFCTQKQTLIDPPNFDRSYKRFFSELRQTHPEVPFLSTHCCRHTFATLTLDAGGDICTVQELLGHGDIRTTSRYVHPHIPQLRKAIADMLDTVIFH